MGEVGLGTEAAGRVGSAARPRGRASTAWLPLLLSLLPRVVLASVLVAVGMRWHADARHVAPREAGTPEWAWVLSRSWDSNAYLGIASDGYDSDFERGFPPGYPLLVRGVMALVPDAHVAGVLVSNACALLAIVAFVRLAARLAAPGADLLPATMVFACTPGVLAFGTVAYSESAAILLGLLGWMAWLRAEGHDAGAARHLGWLLVSSAAFGAAVLVRHLAGATLLAVGVIEVLRVARPVRVRRRRALLEAAAALSATALVAGYLTWKYVSHDLARVDAELWGMHFRLLGGPASLVGLVDPESIAVLFLTLPLVVLLLVGLARLDWRLALVASLSLVVALSFTGIAAQSVNRHAWSAWPLALGVLRVQDRAVGWALAGVLFMLSTWCGLGYVRGTLAL